MRRLHPGSGLSRPCAKHPDKAVIGKNGWLFYSNETLDSKWAPGTAETIDTIARFNRILADNDIALVVTMVPLKMRIYREQLPDASALGSYGEMHYAEALKALAARDVRTIDLNAAFLASPKRTGDTRSTTGSIRTGRARAHCWHPKW